MRLRSDADDIMALRRASLPIFRMPREAMKKLLRPIESFDATAAKVARAASLLVSGATRRFRWLFRLLSRQRAAVAGAAGRRRAPAGDTLSALRVYSLCRCNTHAAVKLTMISNAGLAMNAAHVSRPH